MILLLIFYLVISIVGSLQLVYYKLEDINSIGKLQYITIIALLVGVIVSSPLIFTYVVFISVYEYLK